ncbi:MAG: DUF2974 domain-containing protein [Lachnospiraceae bacterium]|nr:DUF2974 domain-containing protein [Lachnospiraceae bacterium]
MANIVDYVLWRGDYTFEKEKCNLIDNFIFCQLSYIDMTDVFEENDRFTIGQVWEKIGKKAKFKLLTDSEKNQTLLEVCAHSKRFQNVVISDYEDNTEVRENKQFAAMTFHLTDSDAFVAFRGTDETIVGWKEDFMLSYCRVPAQQQALNYAKHMISKNKNCFLGGHSKGANLALYAASHLDSVSYEKVEKVFLNDGPGFCPDVLDTGLINRIDAKCVRVTPEYCIVGAIFEPAITESYIVKSDENQMLQHSLMSWQVLGNQPETLSNHDIYSEATNRVFDKFIEKMDNLEDRQAFVNSIFDTMAQNGAYTIADFMKEGPNALENLMVTVLGENEEGLNPLNSVLQNVKLDIKHTKGWKLWKEATEGKTIVRIVLSLVLAALCYVIPKNLIETVFAILIATGLLYQLSQTLYHLWKSKWDFEKERLRIAISFVLVIAYTILMIKDHALFLVSSIILGFFFIYSAYRCVLKLRANKDDKWKKARYGYEMVLSALCGGYLILSSSVSIQWYTLSMGFLIITDAIFEIIALYRRHKKAGQ